ncbi:MAG TPA: phosphoribosylformylglycinamidine synthase subunit PurL, partial [Bacteroidia bacterium]|nr:phosphoribosylformylglycinamidine synthase subunit PurL [Bacteroidia bacterium]
FVTLAESAMPRGLGFDINSDGVVRKDAFLFGEGQSRVVVSVSPGKEDAFVEHMLKTNAEFSMLGVVVGKEFVVDEESLGDVSTLKKDYDSAITNIMGA